MFSHTYIPNDAERVAMYRELDNIESELEILDFERRLEDRFGKSPQPGKELIRVVRLRRIAKSLGIEKVVLKGKQMTLFLVSDPQSPYYESRAFEKLLTYIQQHPRECQLREVNHKRSVVIKNGDTVEMAVHVMEEISKIQVDER